MKEQWDSTTAEAARLVYTSNAADATAYQAVMVTIMAAS